MDIAKCIVYVCVCICVDVYNTPLFSEMIIESTSVVAAKKSEYILMPRDQMIMSQLVEVISLLYFVLLG